MADDMRLKEAEFTPPLEDKSTLGDTPKMSVKPSWSKPAIRKRLFTWLGLGVGALVIAGALYWVFVASRYQSTDNAYVGASSAQISAQVSGLIKEAPVGEMQHVRAGDVLLVIDPADAQLAVQRAEADYRRVLQRVRGYGAETSAARAAVAARQADLSRAETDYERREQLASSGAVSADEVTSARTALATARADLVAARENYAASRTQAPEGAPEDHPEALAAKAALDAARLDLERTRIVSPIDGVVVQNRVQIGQQVTPGAPLMSVVPLSEAYVDANFKETQLRQMQIGQPVRLTSDLYGDHVVYHGRVAGLGAGSGSAFALIPAQNATGNWIKVVQRVPVRISLDPEELAAHPLRVGLSMRATVDVSR